MSESENREIKTDKPRITRKQFLMAGAAVCAAGLVDGCLLEPNWIQETELDMSRLNLNRNFVQFSDLHYKGDKKHLAVIKDRIIAAKPDAVFFTGDLVEFRDTHFLDEVLHWISEIPRPVYGVQGNHDPVDPKSIADFHAAFNSTGGAFLNDDITDLGDMELHGVSMAHGLTPKSGKPRMLLCHYPEVGRKNLRNSYQLTMCGHSHGGQVRIPFIGAPIVPPGCGGYIKGYYDTGIGPLYVNVGCGTFFYKIRFACRPEITTIRT